MGEKNDRKDAHKIIHAGCDGLTVALQGYLPASVQTKLDGSKQAAKDMGQDAALSIHGSEFNVMPSGTSNVQGYTWQFHTGRHGIKYQAKRSLDGTQWNLRARASALFLAVHGFKGAADQIYKDLAALNASIFDDSVSTIDFCCDQQIDAPGTPRNHAFDLKPGNFIFHSKAKRREFYSKIDLDSEDLSIIGGRYCETVSIGSKAARQITVYNKRTEQIAKRRGDWFGVWGIEKEDSPNVWRTEYRFGRDYMRDFNIRSLQDIDAAYGDLLHDSFGAVRYTMPTGDSNQSRWPNHPFWDAAISALSEIADSNRSGLLRGRLADIEQEDAINIYQKQIAGNLAPLTVALGLSSDELDKAPELVADFIRDYMTNSPTKFEDGRKRAIDRMLWAREMDTKNSQDTATAKEI